MQVSALRETLPGVSFKSHMQIPAQTALQFTLNDETVLLYKNPDKTQEFAAILKEDENLVIFDKEDDNWNKRDFSIHDKILYEAASYCIVSNSFFNFMRKSKSQIFKEKKKQPKKQQAIETQFKSLYEAELVDKYDRTFVRTKGWNIIIEETGKHVTFTILLSRKFKDDIGDDSYFTFKTSSFSSTFKKFLDSIKKDTETIGIALCSTRDNFTRNLTYYARNSTN